MNVRKRHLWWLLAPILFALLLIAIQAFFHARQNIAIGHIERLGGRVLTTHGEPDWLRRLIGNKSLKLFQKATVVNLTETATTDSELAHLQRLNGLERLNLSKTEITNTGLEHLKRLAGLKALDLSGTQISGQGLERVGKLTNLEYLYLSDTQIADGDLHHLKELMNLRHLDVAGTAVSSKGVEAIKRQLPDVEVKR